MPKMSKVGKIILNSYTLYFIHRVTLTYSNICQKKMHVCMCVTYRLFGKGYRVASNVHPIIIGVIMTCLFEHKSMNL